MNPEDEKQDVSIAVMARDISYIKESLKKIDTRLEIMDGHYIKRVEVETMKVEADKVHADLEVRLRSMELDYAKFQTQVRTWGIVAVMGLGVVQFLIGKFL